MKLHLPLAALLGGALVLGLLAGCGSDQQAAPADYPVTAGGTIIEERPTAVASLAPATTDLLFQLQLPGRLRVIGDYCEPPAEPGDIDYYAYPRAGSPQLPDLEVLIENNIDLVFTTAPLPESISTALQQQNIDIVVLSPAADLEGVWENWRAVYKVLYGEETGGAMAEEFIARFDSQLAELDARVAEATASGRLTAVYLAGDVLTMATGDSLQGELLTRMGLDNWGDDYTGYRFPKEREVELDPDLVLFNGMMTKEAIAASGCYKTTKAGTAGRIYYLDPENFERQTPDLINTLWKLGQIAYPEHFVRETPGSPWEQDAAGEAPAPEAEESPAQA